MDDFLGVHKTSIKPPYDTNRGGRSSNQSRMSTALLDVAVLLGAALL